MAIVFADLRELRPVRRRRGGHQGRESGQAQDAVQLADAAAGADQQGKPARIAEGNPRQIDDDPAGLRQAGNLLTQHGYGATSSRCLRCAAAAGPRHGVK